MQRNGKILSISDDPLLEGLPNKEVPLPTFMKKLPNIKEEENKNSLEDGGNGGGEISERQPKDDKQLDFFENTLMKLDDMLKDNKMTISDQIGQHQATKSALGVVN